MLPVIRHIETCDKFKDVPIHVTFGVNIRDEDYRKKLSNNNKNNKSLANKVRESLEKLKDRKFDRELFNKIIENKNLKISDDTINLICGPKGSSRSLIDKVVDNKYIPNKNEKDEVIVSFFKDKDIKLDKEIRYYIEATGPWHKVTWLETTLMQCVYETLLKDKLEKEGKSYSTWLFEALTRCVKSVDAINELTQKHLHPFKGALFTGRRTGGYAFLLLQNLYVKDNYKECLGTSSVDAWNKINKLEQEGRSLIPIGTHAHELSMVLSALLHEANSDTYPITQIIGHYLYYLYSNDSNDEKIPMLPDTLGTEAFMNVASKITINTKDKSEKPFMEIIGSARQDSGNMDNFVKIMDKYKFNGSIMASEIENTKSLEEAYELKHSDGSYAYTLFGAGGYFGDSEKAWNNSKKNISMAVKASRIFVNYEETSIKPIKTGNSKNNGKLEINGLLSKDKFNIAKERAIIIKNKPKTSNNNTETVNKLFNNMLFKILKNDDKFLVVVDFQNCFISGGSFGEHKSNDSTLENSINQTIEIEELIDNNENIIFTRDFHPINHRSIGINGKVAVNHSATWPSHCLNTSSVCKRNKNYLNLNGEDIDNKNYGLTKSEIEKIQNRTYTTIGKYLSEFNSKSSSNLIQTLINKFKVNESLLEKQIIGTNISFTMLMTKYKCVISQLIHANNPIGIPIDKNKNTVPTFNSIKTNGTVIKTKDSNVIQNNNIDYNKTFVQLVKGQYCGYESHSAFNYHWKINLTKKLTNSELATYEKTYISNKTKDYSTGLFEYILNTSKKNIINITICGLVGEVCVIRSIIEGLIMWNMLYKNENSKKKVIFNYSLMGTLFTGIGLDGFEKNAIQKSNDDFYNKLCSYLDENVYKTYKKYIKFNILDKNGNYCRTIYLITSNNKNTNSKFIHNGVPIIELGP